MTWLWRKNSQKTEWLSEFWYIVRRRVDWWTVKEL